jgi:hypothetical protein
MSEVEKEIKFVVKTLNHIGVEIEQPVPIYCDNVGAIFMSENTSATTRTKHVDARYHFVRDYVFDKFVKIIFVRSDDNKSDMFTKNVTSDLYEKHKNEYIMIKDEIEKTNWSIKRKGVSG